ncbi:MAG: VOC family protein [Alphaproteobacteria bacterium]|nr:VOC family protein [Alphaproteobacteria bacterium]
MVIATAAKTSPRMNPTSAATSAPRTRGIHHLALNTDDIKMTTDYYVDVVGMKLVHAMKIPSGLGTGEGNRGNPPFENLRHYFFDMGQDSLLAFFEMPKGAKEKGDRDALAGMQHVAFSVTPEEFASLQERLKARGDEIIGPVEILPDLYSIYFFDPNGIRLEACCHPKEGAHPNVVGGVAQSRADARAELQTLTGDTGWLEKRLSGFED